MIRTIFAATLLAVTAMPASAQVLGDFDCYSDLDGPYTPAGLLRIEDPTSFSFLDLTTARPGKSFPMEMFPDDTVNFDDAFADQISPGAIMIDAQMVEDDYSYYARILTRKGREVSVSCPFIY
ncbi:hypothetical protein [Devosia ginsengisoli]|uniref:hypothetical protein n=1 Tax=Devosia ginsengisoli TaxID=400770 RepID=UPI0026F1553B|nr:hypothetical protein [Devosia ginsengisoli]MCR6672658.1 hypothetical protein [Devosia ginsengisoli]